MPMLQLDLFERDHSKLVPLKLHRKPRKKKVDQVKELQKTVADLMLRIEVLEKLIHPLES